MKTTVSMTPKLHQAMTQTVPALGDIFQLGKIPSKKDFVEMKEDMYRAYERQSGVSNRPLYIMKPRGFNSQSVSVKVLDQGMVENFMEAIKFLKRYAREHNLSPAADQVILAHAAKDFPRELSDGTPFEQPVLKVLHHPEKTLTSKESWMRFLEYVAGENETMFIKYQDSRGVEIEEALSPKGEKALGASKMSYDEFKDFTLKYLRETYDPAVYEFSEDISQKTDVIAHDFIKVIKNQEGRPLQSGFQFTPFYRSYTMGTPPEEVMKDIQGFIQEAEEYVSQLRPGSLTDFDEVKDSLIVRPLNYQNNRKQLEPYVFKRFGDIALVVYMLMINPDQQMYTAKVDQETAGKWDLSQEELFDWAIQNTEAKFKACLYPMDAVIEGISAEQYPAVNKYFNEPGFELEASKTGTYSLFLEGGNTHAATAVFYHNALKNLAEAMRDDLYVVIPSMTFVMVHEKSSVSLNRLRRYARDEKNNPHNDPAEFLSDGVYFYSRKEDSFRLIYQKK